MNVPRIIIAFSLLAVSISLAEDVVHLKNGKSQAGKIVSVLDAGVVLSYKRDLGNGVSGESKANVRWELIDRIEFEESALERSFIAEPEKADLEAFQKLVNTKMSLLGRPNSNAGKVIIAWAKRKANSSAEMAEEEAMDLLELVAQQSWSPEDQSAAVTTRLEIMLQHGKVKEAVREATLLAEESEEPTALLSAQYFLGQNEETELREIEEENPRWDIDDKVRPVRNSHYNAAIDHYLFAFLFYGAEEEPAAKGMLAAARVYATAEDDRNAQHLCEDILKLYPSTDSVEEAEALLKTILEKSKEDTTTP